MDPNTVQLIKYNINNRINIGNDNKTLEVVDKEVSALNEMKEGVKSGAFSLRGAVEILEHQTGRKLSAMGLKKIIDKDKPVSVNQSIPSLLNKNE